MALSLTLGAVSADEAAADVAAAEDAPVVGEAAGGDVVVEDIPIADVETDVAVLEETPYEIIWGIGAANNGPDVAYDTMVFIDGSDNLAPYDYIATTGELVYDPLDGVLVWFVGDLLPNQVEYLLLDTVKMDEGPYWVDAFIQTASFDPDLSNNYDIAWADVPEVSAVEETMPAAGNPIAMALLALIAIAGATISRRF